MKFNIIGDGFQVGERMSGDRDRLDMDVQAHKLIVIQEQFSNSYFNKKNLNLNIFMLSLKGINNGWYYFPRNIVYQLVLTILYQQEETTIGKQ